MFAATALVALGPMCGCLNLGGKTTYVTEGGETSNRLSSLEARVGALEATVHGRPLTTTSDLPEGYETLQPGVVYPPAASPAMPIP